MFNKKYCGNCREKVNNKYRFCPNCGTEINNSKQEDWGMLGRNDSMEEETFQGGFLGGFGGGMLNKMLVNTMKMLEKEMQRDMKNTRKINRMPRTNMKLMINGREVMFGQPQPVKKQVIKEIPKNEFREEQLRAFSELPRQEPKTNLKRFGDKIIYELEMPEVSSFKDILINRLENSIEIKAIGKTKSYFKIIPIGIPIVSQRLLPGKLILELMEN